MFSYFSSVGSHFFHNSHKVTYTLHPNALNLSSSLKVRHKVSRPHKTNDIRDLMNHSPLYVYKSSGRLQQKTPVHKNLSIDVMGGYLATARILLTCVFVSAGRCLASSYLATAAVHRVTAQQRVYGPQYERTMKELCTDWEAMR
jgi:hypothetical protein